MFSAMLPRQVEYELDEGLISFGSCLERGQYAKAGPVLCAVLGDSRGSSCRLSTSWRPAARLASGRRHHGALPGHAGAPAHAGDRSHVALAG